MSDFDTYLSQLALHEAEKSILDARQKILVYAWVHLNWMGDMIANPHTQFEKREIPTNKIRFTGNLAWNRILIEECHGRVEDFQALLEKKPELREKFAREASYSDDPILIRGPDVDGFYKVYDGMHRLLGAVLENRVTIAAYVAIEPEAHLPICEAHVIYDLIRWFQRHAYDEAGKEQLFHALKLLTRTYENVRELLIHRFDYTHVADEVVQEIIGKVFEK